METRAQNGQGKEIRVPRRLTEKTRILMRKKILREVVEFVRGGGHGQLQLKLVFDEHWSRRMMRLLALDVKEMFFANSVFVSEDVEKYSSVLPAPIVKCGNGLPCEFRIEIVVDYEKHEMTMSAMLTPPSGDA